MLGETQLLLSKIDRLPTLPHVALKLLAVTEDEFSSPQDVAALIETDSSLAAKTLKMANSSFYGKSGEISTIRDAVVLIGFNAVRSTVLSVCVIEVFKEKHSVTGFEAEAFWIHSLACALCCRGISKRNGASDTATEEAYVCGLLHDVGKILLDHYLPDEYEKVMRFVADRKVSVEEAETAVLGTNHATVGSELLRTWMIPEHLVEAVALHHQVSGKQTKGDPSGKLAAIVSMSNTIVRIHKTGSGGDAVPGLIDPSIRAALGLTQDDIIAIASELDSQIWDAAASMGIDGSAKKSPFELLQESSRELALLRSLSESDKKYRILFDGFPDAIIIMTDVILECNQQACQLLACGRDDLIDNSFKEVLPPLQPDGSSSAMTVFERMRTAQGGTPQSFSFQLQRKNGVAIDTEISMKAFPVARKPSLLLTVRDVTERKQMEEALKRAHGELEIRVEERTADLRREIAEHEQTQRELRESEEQLRRAERMEAIGTLAGGIAHDFNNILAAIIGYTELALTDLGQETQLRPRLERILQSGLRAKELVNEMLTFSRQADRDRKPIRINAVVKEALNKVQASLPPAVEMHRDIGAESALILANPTQINQIISNLCTNAVHAMDNQRGTITVSLTEETLDAETATEKPPVAPGTYVIVSVGDNGRGMDEVVRKRIFNPFFTTKEPGEGTGMGLSVVHGIIASHEGTITVDSSPGKGTTIRVLLPKLSQEGMADSKGIQTRPARILVADDDDHIRQILRDMLEDEGHQVVLASDGKEAMGLYRDNLMDLIITDLVMPEKEGLDLIFTLRKEFPEIKIIAISGGGRNSAGQYLRVAKKLGAIRTIAKPFSRQEILDAVQQAID